MKQVIINEIMQGMVKHLDNSQMKMLYKVLEKSFVGFEVLEDKQCVNNITTMEDCLSVIACGAGAISKIVHSGENRIERFANMRDLRLYMQNFEEKLKDKLFFYEKQFTK
jgi:oxygen-independent coproporphyrinogen-3 oxidase